jgi:FAD dependent oxidoreductase
MQDRPVLGGNASSEIRMWICGARGEDNKETGIVEEIMLDNYYRNPGLKYAIWDTVLYEKAKRQPNLALLLNCTCNQVKTAGNRIVSLKGWQLTTQTWHAVEAASFADCSGDSVLRVSGAEFRSGRESRHEFNESLAVAKPNRHTMGSSVLIQLREVDEHIPFIPPTWAHKYSEADLAHRSMIPDAAENFWWLEIGGLGNTIRDTEANRDELLKMAYGVWDFIKNHPDGRGHRWELEWIGMLPGKRENVRYVGDHILTQNDILAEGRFDDMVAYGGWPMDDHPSEAFHYRGEPTVFHRAPSPYGIPYRCLYSRNIENLFFAGRNISATHMGISSTRVMATCAIMGQAVGAAAALAVRHNCSPRGVYEAHVRELQEVLMDDDCYLPWHTRPIAEISQQAALSASAGDPEPLRNGVDRSLGEADNGWWGAPGDWVEYRFAHSTHLAQARFTFDSNLRDKKHMPCSYPKKGNHATVPSMMTRDFDIVALDAGGQWVCVAEMRGNYQRLVRVPLDVTTQAVRFVLRASWGAERAHVFGFEVR